MKAKTIIITVLYSEQTKWTKSPAEICGMMMQAANEVATWSTSGPVPTVAQVTTSDENASNTGSPKHD